MSEVMFVPMPMPIITPSSSGSGEVEYVYPFLVEAFFAISVIVTLTGFVWLVGALCLSIITGDDSKYDVFEKPHSLSFALLMGGIVLLVISVILLVITGQPIEGGVK